MKHVWSTRFSVPALCVGAALALAGVLFGATPARAQDADGRSSGGASTSGPRVKPRTRPKKRIRARPSTDVEKVPTSSVIIRSYPDGAEVFVDGKLVGTTADDGEVELEDMRLGAHHVLLKKAGFRDWSQTITLRTVDPVEVNPVLQSASSPLPRDLSKVANIEMGTQLSGQLTREDTEATDGSGFYDELRFRLQAPDALLVKMTATGFTPALKIVDDDNRSFEIRPLAPGLYQTVTLPRPGTYYLRVSAAIDETSFVGGDYALTLRSEAASQAPQRIAVGETGDGALEETDRMRGPEDFYDVWTFEGRPGVTVQISATSSEFTPSLTLLLNNSTVAVSGSAPAKKPKKGAPVVPDNTIQQALTAGTYTVYVRSAAGAKRGAYRLAITTAAGQ